MHIQQVQIKNFRCFENLTVNLNPDVNIFVGNNGSGKSAVLDAIAAAMYPYLAELQSAIEPNPEFSNIPSFPIFQRDLPSKEITDDYFNESKFCVSMSEFPEWKVTYIKRVGGIGDSPLNIDCEEYSEDIFEQPQLAAINKLLENLKNDTDTQLLVIAYYKVSRDLKNITNIKKLSAQSFDRFDSLKNPFDAISSFTDLANWFFTRELQELREGKKRKDIDFEFSDLKQIRKAITTVIAPNARIYFSQTESTQLMVEWQTETGEKIELSLNQLSSGYRNMLALVMDFARRLALANPQMENPLEAEAILMIDELDLHLHPTWQQKIIPDLRKVFPNTQIIATTHSPEIVTTVERHQVKILENYQIKECPTPTRGRTSSDIVRDVLGLNNLRPDTKESKTLAALFDAIDNGNLEEAKKLREELQDWEMFDAEITRADMQIQRLKRKLSA
jgi:predicted ATP-binding protein involved in virulence